MALPFRTEICFRLLAFFILLIKLVKSKECCLKNKQELAHGNSEFNNTGVENIRIGKKDATDEEVVKTDKNVGPKVAGISTGICALKSQKTHGNRHGIVIEYKHGC